MSSMTFHSMGCMQEMWYVARSDGGSKTFFLVTGIDSKESEHIQIYGIDVVGGRRTGCRSHPHSAERLEEVEENWSVG